jgi:hypothetical protein
MREPIKDYVEWGPDLSPRNREQPRAPRLDEPATRARLGDLIARMIVSARRDPRRPKRPLRR